MRAAIGATEQEFDILTREGVLTPFTRVANTKRRWRIADGEALVDALARSAISVSADDDAWETLLNARRRAGVSLAALIRIIRDGGLPVGRRAGNHGFHAIVVPIARIEAFSEASPDELSPRSDLLGSLFVSGFGRSIGLRDTGYLVSLVEAGHTPALPVLSPSTGRNRYRFRPADIAAFHDRFVTLTSLSAATNLHRNTLKTRLLAFGVMPFTHGECSDGTVYLRTEAFSALG